jgi:hypothetical protein
LSGSTRRRKTVTQILADAEMAKQLEEAEGPVQVVNDKGTVIAVCTPVKFPHSPYSREEVERRREEARKHPEQGKSLAEILAQLKQLDGGAA